MKLKARGCRKNEKGEAMLITTILILVMMLIVGTSMNVAGMQWDMVYMQKNTSNTYYLAKSGVEKGADTVNKAIQAQIPIFIQEIRDQYLKPLTDLNEVRLSGQHEDFYYSSNEAALKKMQYKGDKFLIDKKVVASVLHTKIYDFIAANYFDKEVKYQVQGDGQTETSPTQITIAFKAASPVNTSHFIIDSSAKTADGKDIKRVEAIITIEVPSEIDNEIHEAYNWLYNPPEILDSAITCFSDVVITEGAKLTVIGDIRVKGTSRQTTLQTVGGEPVLKVPDMNEIGGIIASNGGRLEVKSPSATLTTVTSRPESSYYSQGNIIISNKIMMLAPASAASYTSGDNYTTNTGSIYCVNNVATTHGWALNAEGTNTDLDKYNDSAEAIKSAINVEGDIVANTLAIYDDFYVGGPNQSPWDGERVVSGNKIRVDGNIFVDNDVKIDKYVKDSSILCNEGSIFGISDGTLGPTLKVGTREFRDPNTSSGIFNRGDSLSFIKADGMFINGQPFIDFGKGIFYALWESIGEPFQDVSSFTGYSEVPPDPAGNPSYLDSEAQLYENIKKDKVTISNIEGKTYTPNGTFVSANGFTKTYNNFHLGNKEEALKFFYTGGSAKSIKDLTGRSKDEKYDHIQEMFDSFNKYYIAEYGAANLSEGYYKHYIKDLSDPDWPDLTKDYRGLRGYMLSKRSIFYGSFNEATKAPGNLSFEQVVDLGGMSDKSWSYETPIQVVNGGSIDIDKYYVEDEQGNRPYPSIIINPSSNVLEVTGTSGSLFKGIIISQGNVKIKGKLSIEGAIIIGGYDHSSNTDVRARDNIMLGQDVGLRLSGSTTDVTIIHNPDILLSIQASDKMLLRAILDALKITQFKDPSSHSDNKDIAVIFGPYTKNALHYTQGRVKLSNQSILDVTTQNIKVKIKTMRKVND
ncbi:hypothetical protein [Cellulosilyticum sp. I15G10I2]|uniref:hypothetical protein n=1 Tax=Cellulosilyticum sp. I15G10I2 TaxID=1892843 RepID=UPI00085CA5D6|nr:hypothetical protein [Cellulosilyticum sp. I15G10I2]